MTKKKLLPHENEMIIQLAIEGLIKGHSREDLSVLILGEHSNVDQEEADKLIKQAVKIINEEVLTDIDKIIPQHIEIYEKIYKDFDEVRFVPGKLKALKGKEKLVGLHKEQNFIEVHNEINLEVEVDSQYELSKLNPQEVKRLEALQKKIER